MLTEALAAVHKFGERRWKAKLYWLKGELLLALSPADAVEAEACFQQALDITRCQ